MAAAARRRPPGRSRGDGGYLLIEAVAGLLLIGLALSIVALALPTATRRPDFDAVLARAEAILRATRNEAVLGGRSAVAVVDVDARRLRGAGGRVLALPADVRLRLVAASSCRSVGGATEIVFRADGSSCGMVLGFERQDMAARVRVNWYDGSVSVARGPISGG